MTEILDRIPPKKLHFMGGISALVFRRDWRSK